MTLKEIDGRWLCRKSKKAKTEEDVTEIIEWVADDVISLMGRAGRTEFHAYLCREKTTWKQMYGVTSLLSYWGEKDKLVQWAVDKTIESFQLGGEDGASADGWVISREYWARLTEQARTAHKRSLNEASDLGTKVHAEVEAYIKKCIEYGGKLHGVGLEGASEQAREFMHWAMENDVEFLASEKVVYSKRLWCAGTMDFLCRINGKLMIGDVKTSNWISPKHFLQCGAYASFYEEMHPLYEIGMEFSDGRFRPTERQKGVEGVVIVQLPRDGGIKAMTNTDVGQTVDNLEQGFEKVVSLCRMDKDISSNLYL